MRETKEDRAARQQREEWQLVDLLRRAGNAVEAEVPVPNTDGRKWRVDYLIVTTKQKPTGGMAARLIALEIQGWGFGHVGRSGWLRDIEKAQAIAANGWLYVPVTREMVANGDALEALNRCGVKVTC